MTDEGERRLHKRMDEVNDKLASIDKHVAEVAATCVPCKAQVKRLDQVIHGNGREGLAVDVATLKADQAKADEAHAELVREQVRGSRWQRTQLGAVLVTLLSIIGMAAKYIFG